MGNEQRLERKKIQELKIAESFDIEPLSKEEQEQIELVNRSLNQVEMRALELYTTGYARTTIEAQFKKKGLVLRFNTLLRKPEAKEYILKLLDEYKQQSFTNKNELIRVLKLRLESASNRDIVPLIDMISKLEGYTEEGKGIGINITAPSIEWCNDPFIEQREKEKAERKEERYGEVEEEAKVEEVEFVEGDEDVEDIEEDDLLKDLGL